MPNCSPVRRMIIVKPDPEFIIHSDYTAFADSMRSSMPQEDVAQVRLRSQLYSKN